MLDHTIAAISTSLSASGIGIIRISGDEAIAIADRLFVSHKKKQLKDQKKHIHCITEISLTQSKMRLWMKYWCPL